MEVNYCQLKAIRKFKGFKYNKQNNVFIIWVKNKIKINNVPFKIGIEISTYMWNAAAFLHHKADLCMFH